MLPVTVCGCVYEICEGSSAEFCTRFSLLTNILSTDFLQLQVHLYVALNLNNI
uniref:Uncharacterized protein n=1 Tax=Aegilops tauschii subsp. strangulata TaxID=200361 RepID=A0A453JFE3_AEGTS